MYRQLLPCFDCRGWHIAAVINRRGQGGSKAGGEQNAHAGPLYLRLLRSARHLRIPTSTCNDAHHATIYGAYLNAIRTSILANDLECLFGAKHVRHES
jgi:hypothetical protein